jgi:hypothetical protein
VPTGIPEIATSDNNYSLKSYPNPFSESAIISMYIPDAIHVTLDVYNFAGVKVKSLVSNKLIEGEYTVTINFDSLEGGVYFCKMTAGNITKTHKLVLVK